MFLQNRNNVLKNMKDNTIAIFYSGKKMFKSGDQSFPLEVNKNFYYLTGINQANVTLMLIKTTKCIETFLFVEQLSSLKKLWDDDNLSTEEIAINADIPNKNIIDIANFNIFLNKKINNNYVNQFEGIYLDLFYSQLEFDCNWALKKAREIKLLYPFLKIYNSAYILLTLRKSKNNQEIHLIKKAIEINNKALMYMLKKIKNCQYEYQTAALYNYYLKNKNTKESFETIAAVGKNALILHYQKNKDILNPNEMLLFDAGVTYKNYSSDITRCYPITGVFNELQKKIYQLVLKTNKKIIEWVKPNYNFKELNKYGKNILSQGMKELGFLKEDENIEQYCYHGLGHHLGLDVHDLKDFDNEIGDNSVITIEPGLYLKQFNIGIRIEDNILVTKNGNINLSSNIPKEIEEIEKLMKNTTN